MAAVVVFGAVFGTRWGLTVGRVTAFLFLAQLFLDPFSGPAGDLQRHADRDRRLAEDPLGPRPPGGDRRTRARHGARPRRARGPRAGRAVPLPRRRRPRAARDLARRPRRRARRDRRRDRLREDDVREAPGAPGRPGRRTAPVRRDGPARDRAGVPASRDPHGAPGRVPVRRDDPRERPIRPRGRHRPGRRDRVRGARARRMGGVVPGRSGHDGRRTRRGALGRRTTARRARARADRVPGIADPRRGDERGRPGDRAHGSPKRCGDSPPAGRSSRSRTASRPRSTPKTCSSSTRAGWWRRERTPSSWRAAACTPGLHQSWLGNTRARRSDRSPGRLPRP